MTSNASLKNTLSTLTRLVFGHKNDAVCGDGIPGMVNERGDVIWSRDEWAPSGTLRRRDDRGSKGVLSRFRGDRQEKLRTGALKMVAASLSEGTFTATKELQECWPEEMGGTHLTDKRARSIQIELLWFMLVALLREIHRRPEEDLETRETIRGDLIPSVINHLLDLEGHRSKAPKGIREKQSGRMTAWYTEAEDAYAGIIRILPAPHDLSLDDNLCGNAAKRMAKAVGRDDQVTSVVFLTSWVIRSYTAIELANLVDTVSCAYIDNWRTLLPASLRRLTSIGGSG
jgi:hypothetical protein